MEISVTKKNEIKFVPEIGGNKKQLEQNQFRVILKRVNTTLENWSSFSTDGKLKVDYALMIKAHIVRLENAPMLSIDGGTKKRLLEIEDLFNDEFAELFEISNQLLVECSRIDKELALDTKKS